MVHYYDSIEPELNDFAMQQTVFFIGSAPLNGKHINVSPKGLPSTSFSILNPNLCAYVDATGSGIETIANMYENGRCTVMFCSFGPSPRIMRFFCRGRVVEWDDPGFDGWLKRMGEKSFTGMRAVIVLEVFKVQTSCGFAVPYLALKSDEKDSSKKVPYLEDRKTLGHWAGKRIAQNEMDDYRARMNTKSLDGLPGLRRGRKDAGERIWLGDAKAKITKPGTGLHSTLIAVVSSMLTILLLYILGVLEIEPWLGPNLDISGLRPRFPLKPIGNT